jgi:predicted aminopeptidase
MNQDSKKRGAKRWLLLSSLLAMAAWVAGCQTLSFYGQAIKGQYQIVAHRKSIEKLIADPHTPPRLKEQLALVQNLCSFAQTNLKLPAEGQYRKYVDLQRPYVVWNVQAAAPFSLQPKTWWYPLVGSLEYHGYFSERGATNYARQLQAKGYEVNVDGVEAYSTLGWFNDPVLNTFVYREAPELAEVIFHELAHQRLFAGGDTDFDEAFATTVGQEGARRWLGAQSCTNDYHRYVAALRRNDQFVRLLLETRARLETLYGDTRDENGKIKAARKLPAAADQLSSEKQVAFEDLRRDYALLKSGWNGFSGYDYWFAPELNNARLNSVANYYDLVPGFEQLLRLYDRDMEKFYQAAERLSDLSKERRHHWLQDLAKGGSRKP